MQYKYTYFYFKTRFFCGRACRQKRLLIEAQGRRGGARAAYFGVFGIRIANVGVYERGAARARCPKFASIPRRATGATVIANSVAHFWPKTCVSNIVKARAWISDFTHTAWTARKVRAYVWKKLEEREIWKKKSIHIFS